MNFKELPKVELHRHLEGAIRFSTLVNLSKNAGWDLPYDNEDKLKEKLLIKTRASNLKEAIDKFLFALGVVNSKEALEQVAFEACEDAFKEGIKVLELRFSPSFIQIQHSHFSYEDILESIVSGVSRASINLPIKVGLIGIIGRNDSMSKATEVMNFILSNKDYFVGVDLADNEDGFDSKPFAPLFEKAKSEGLGITIHSGEINVPKAPFFVKDAIDILGADRIGHGVQIYREPEMIDYVIEKEVLLELCPTSNILTNSISTIQEHPFKKLYEAGVKVSINSDDPGSFDIDLINEYEALSKYHGLSESDFKKINETTLSYSFIKDK